MTEEELINSVEIKLDDSQIPNQIIISSEFINKKGDIIKLNGFGPKPLKAKIASIKEDGPYKKIITLEMLK